jgi:hypothetical protein
MQRQGKVSLKGSVRAIQDPETSQYIAFADERKAPSLAPLHLATLAPADCRKCTEELLQLASRRGVRGDLVRVDA